MCDPGAFGFCRPIFFCLRVYSLALRSGRGKSFCLERNLGTGKLVGLWTAQFVLLNGIEADCNSIEGGSDCLQSERICPDSGQMGPGFASEEKASRANIASNSEEGSVVWKGGVIC